MIRAIYMANGDRVLVPSSWTAFTVLGHRLRQPAPGAIEVKRGAHWERKLATKPLNYARRPQRPRSADSVARREMAAASRAVIREVSL